MNCRSLEEWRVENTMTTLKILVLLWICHCVFLQGSVLMKNESIALSPMTVSTGASKSVTLVPRSQDSKTDFLSPPSSTEEKSAALTVAASGVISFIVILVVIVIILVCVVTLRFRCHRCKDAKDKKKPQHPVVTYSISDAETTGGMKNVLLVSKKDLNTSNNKDVMKTIITCEE